MANILMSANIACRLRGPIQVKGKGIITTYFVKTPFDKKLENMVEPKPYPRY